MSVPAVHARGMRCRFCGHFRAPEDFFGGPVVGLCRRCFEWHDHALQILSGSPPNGCQECGLSFRELQALNPAGDVRLRLERKDGIYQVLCIPCSDRFQRKTADRYRGTPYGAARGLNGGMK